MTSKGCNQYPQCKGAVASIIAPVLICIIAIASAAAAQTESATSTAQGQPGASTSTAQTTSPASSSSKAMPKDNAPKLKFNPKPFDVSKLKPGVPVAINLCNDGPAPPPPANDADGMKMDTALTPCGEQNAPTRVSGGNPPYSFQLDSGSFPPLGMHLGMNGLLYGTPAPPTLGGYKPFRVCAVDLSATADCHEVGVRPPAPVAHAGHPALIIGAAVATVGVVGAVAASKMASSNSSTGGSSSNSCSALTTSCNNLAAECLDDNNASACVQISSVCTQMCQCDGFSTFNTETGSCQ